jgi:hypothetical protein
MLTVIACGLGRVNTAVGIWQTSNNKQMWLVVQAYFMSKLVHQQHIELCAACCLFPCADYVKRYATPGCSAASSSKASDDGSDDKMDDDGQQDDSEDGFLTSSEEEDA